MVVPTPVAAVGAAPSQEWIFLNRFAYGPRPGDAQALKQQGISHWLDEQLRLATAGTGPGPECQQKLDSAVMRIKYDAGEGWAALDEMRPLRTLNQPVDALWSLNDPNHKAPYQERIRPRLEMAAATVIHAVYDPAQLRQVMTLFWHDHFSVNAGDSYTAPALPAYDALLRTHALGNFRDLLEAVATSPAMLIYLNNRSSRGGAANENYARELFELHTLGRDAYLNTQYDRWRDVPGALKGAPEGYIDQDVYEASRAFTGWSIQSGQDLGGYKAPNDGRFTYIESWHDNYQKRVLATEFDSYQPPQNDGRKVLDLVANHPATARFVCAKLIRSLVGGDPSPDLLKAAAATWLDNRQRPDQIARVVRLIALSPQATANWGARPKRPLELVASFARATGIPVTASEPLVGTMDSAGQRLYAWPSPDGHPVADDYWLGAQNMRIRWTLVLGLAEGYWMPPGLSAMAQMGPAAAHSGQAVAFWSDRLLGSPTAIDAAALLGGLSLAADAPPMVDNKTGEFANRRLAAYVAMSPAFQLR
ncbi:MULTISPECIES: DUF1800 domain-containing protein [Nitrospirillum]|uniref:Uncharacterized protein (DUF1800 family) n=1 Tax=Nitrospirillum amazonense TaxID=28077 RepID=A0A560FHI8_9PROT|nr:DUF1800 domain-containing protein [Nitrospirillum amazonense]MEC4590514.1 DUF1800 domain-containing protein [Nitrospirillum amazonense]TWB21068.1 uncharacterized protein (DUF1800 family) [Nitrospirillum amazonense]